jgi:hypothetical protein
MVAEGIRLSGGEKFDVVGCVQALPFREEL